MTATAPQGTDCPGYLAKKQRLRPANWPQRHGRIAVFTMPSHLVTIHPSSPCLPEASNSIGCASLDSREASWHRRDDHSKFERWNSVHRRHSQVSHQMRPPLPIRPHACRFPMIWVSRNPLLRPFDMQPPTLPAHGCSDQWNTLAQSGLGHIPTINVVIRSIISLVICQLSTRQHISPLSRYRGKDSNTQGFNRAPPHRQQLSRRAKEGPGAV